MEFFMFLFILSLILGLVRLLYWFEKFKQKGGGYLSLALLREAIP